MSLTDKLNTLRKQVMEGGMLPGEAKKVFTEFGAWLKEESGIEQRALNVGDKAPDFTLPIAQGGEFTLSEALKNGPVAVMYYRGKW